MAWQAFLRGQAADLTTLQDQFSEGDVVVEPVDDEWALTTIHWDAATALAVVRAEAATLVRRLNGVGRLLDDDFDGVELVGRYTNGSGTQVVTLDAIGARFRVATGTLTITDADGNVIPPPAAQPPLGPRFLELAQRNNDVDDVFRLLAAPSPLGWVELYKIYEVIKYNLGGEKAVQSAGLAMKHEIKAFTASAQLPSVSGDAARHARSVGGVPKRTMTIEHGRQFIVRLVSGWLPRLLSLGRESPVPRRVRNCSHSDGEVLPMLTDC